MSKEPALIIGTIASVIVALLAIFGVVVDVGTVTGIVVALAPFVSALLIRFHVTPAAKVTNVTSE